MIPAARLQAAIEILDEVIDAAQGGGAAADTLVARYFSTRRYAGSKDRRAVRELVYRAIRAWPEPPPSGRAAMIGLGDPELVALFDGSAHGPAPIGEEETAEGPQGEAVPAWLQPRLDYLVARGEWPSLLERAPLDLRVNLLKGSREEALAALPEATETPHSPLGLRLPDGFRVEEAAAWNTGLVEVQDEGSQLLTLACEAEPGMTVVDLCAGAGGKTLALAAAMANEGRLVACDIDRRRLSRMAPRLAKAGATIVETRLLNPKRELDALADVGGTADLVLVDAPCSGTGTWRRNPELRWRIAPDRLASFVNSQAYLLDLATELVRPGGVIVYAVCALTRAEGRQQAEALADRSAMVSEAVPMAAGRPAGPGRLLTPGHDGTDGFFVARWRAPC